MDAAVPPVESLMPALGFHSGDLAANRAGRLSEDQHGRLRAMRLRSGLIGGGLFLLFALIATGLLFVAQQHDTPILGLVGLLVTVANVIIVGMFGRGWMRLSADLRRGNVAATSGPMERVLRPAGRLHNYALRINGVEFVVNKETFKLFRHEIPYTLYSTPYSHILLAAEPLPDSL